MILNQLDLWLGAESGQASLYQMLSQALQNPATMAAAKLCYSPSSDTAEAEDNNPIIVEPYGSTAIIRVNGLMMTSTSWLTRYFGVPTYEDIKARLIELADQEQYQHVLMYLSSNGGGAIGCLPLAQFIRQYSDKVKNVIGFTDQIAWSAGYALLTGAGRIFAGPESSIGSVGCVNVHYSSFERDKMNGDTYDVTRSAPKKALGMSVEKFSPEARKEVQKEVNMWHDRFADVVAENRNMTVAMVNSKIATGETFTAQESLEKKMIDGILTYEALLAKLTNAVK